MTLAEKLVKNVNNLPDNQQKELEASMDDIIHENKEALLELAK